ncbi:MAG: amidohydrolase family protein, partial [Thermoprotei archaeon]
MVKVLVSNATIMTFSMKEKMLIDEGFVFSDNGRVVVIGSGEPPEELRYPELILTGKERLVMPGFSSAFTNLSSYLLRYREDSLDLSSNIEYLKKITRVDMYFLAAMAFAELISRGVTTALVVDIYLDEVARAAHDLSFNVILAPPLNCGLEEFAPETELRLLLSRWHEKVEGIKAGIAVCNEVSEKVISLAREH